MVAVRSVATKAPEVADYAVEERVSSTQGGRGGWTETLLFHSCVCVVVVGSWV
jgi:hypothetical protein